MSHFSDINWTAIIINGKIKISLKKFKILKKYNNNNKIVRNISVW